MTFSPPEYCRLFAQKKAYQGGVTGTPGPPPPPSYAPDTSAQDFDIVLYNYVACFVQVFTGPCLQKLYSML